MAKITPRPRIVRSQAEIDADEELDDRERQLADDYREDGAETPDAIAPMQKQTAGHARGHYQPEPASDAQLLTEAAEDWCIQRGGASQPGSLENFRDRINLFAHYCELPIHGPRKNEAVTADVAALTTDTVANFVHWLQDDVLKEQRPHHPKHYSRSTVESYVKALITLERFLVPDRKRGGRVPIKEFRELHEVKFQRPAQEELGRLPYTDHERDRLIAAASTGYTGASWRMAVVLLMGTGVREAELCELNLSSPVPDQGYIQLAAIMTKGKIRSRKVTLWADVDTEIRRYLPYRKGPKRADTPLLTNREGKRYDPEGIKGIFRTLQLRCPEIADVMPHRCRNTFAVNCLRLGMSESQLANELGHQDNRMAHRYAKHTTPGERGVEGDTPLSVRSRLARGARPSYFETREPTKEERETHVRKLEGLVPVGRKATKTTR